MLSVVMLGVVMLSVIMLGVIMLNVVIMGVVKLNVVAPSPRFVMPDPANWAKKGPAGDKTLPY
jgi:hypothetical protein